MTEPEGGRVGLIGWADLTVEDATGLREFYSQVVGWQSTEVGMGDYSDYCMDEPQSGQPVAGICHARGLNATMPPVWLIYITVADLDASLSKCVELGGELIAGPRVMGNQDRYCVVRDPAGAVAALFERAG